MLIMRKFKSNCLDRLLHIKNSQSKNFQSSHNSVKSLTLKLKLTTVDQNFSLLNFIVFYLLTKQKPTIKYGKLKKKRVPVLFSTQLHSFNAYYVLNLLKQADNLNTFKVIPISDYRTIVSLSLKEFFSIMDTPISMPTGFLDLPLNKKSGQFIVVIKHNDLFKY